MRKETEEDGQYRMDVRDEAETSMQEAVERAVGSALLQRRARADPVKSRHEGYGLLADAFVKVGAEMKLLQNGMRELLNALPSSDADAADRAESVACSLLDLACCSIAMAAEARRTSGDLYVNAWKEGPEGQAGTDDEGFEEAETEKIAEEG